MQASGEQFVEQKSFKAKIITCCEINSVHAKISRSLYNGSNPRHKDKDNYIADTNSMPILVVKCMNVRQLNPP
jgi:hypothetical protein